MVECSRTKLSLLRSGCSRDPTRGIDIGGGGGPEHERQMFISRICAMMGISKPTLYAYVRAANGVTEGPPAV